MNVHLHHFSKIKIQKEVTKHYKSGFSSYFCLMIEGSGSVLLTSGSGAKRPKNIWIRRIRIRNTGLGKHRLPLFGPLFFLATKFVFLIKLVLYGVFVTPCAVYVDFFATELSFATVCVVFSSVENSVADPDL